MNNIEFRRCINSLSIIAILPVPLVIGAELVRYVFQKILVILPIYIIIAYGRYLCPCKINNYLFFVYIFSTHIF